MTYAVPSTTEPGACEVAAGPVAGRADVDAGPPADRAGGGEAGRDAEVQVSPVVRGGEVSVSSHSCPYTRCGPNTAETGHEA